MNGFSNKNIWTKSPQFYLLNILFILLMEIIGQWTRMQKRLCVLTAAQCDSDVICVYWQLHTDSEVICVYWQLHTDSDVIAR